MEADSLFQSYIIMGKLIIIYTYINKDDNLTWGKHWINWNQLDVFPPKSELMRIVKRAYNRDVREITRVEFW